MKGAAMKAKPRLLRDTRGDSSWTLTLVVPAFVAATGKFLIGGVTLGPLGVMPVMSGIEYATAVAAIIGVWVAREAKDKVIDEQRRLAAPS